MVPRPSQRFKGNNVSLETPFPTSPVGQYKAAQSGKMGAGEKGEYSGKRGEKGYLFGLERQPIRAGEKSSEKAAKP